MAILLALLILLPLQQASSNLVKTEVFVSPEMALGAGSVANKYYYGVGFPGGNIGVRSVNAELIDGGGNPVPLHEAYLHHWLLQRYYAPKNRSRDDYRLIRNSGICDAAVTQYFGLRAETRRTATDIPHPYGIQVGDPAAIPSGTEHWDFAKNDVLLTINACFDCVYSFFFFSNLVYYG